MKTYLQFGISDWNLVIRHGVIRLTGWQLGVWASPCQTCIKIINVRSRKFRGNCSSATVSCSVQYWKSFNVQTGIHFSTLLFFGWTSQEVLLHGIHFEFRWVFKIKFFYKILQYLSNRRYEKIKSYLLISDLSSKSLANWMTPRTPYFSLKAIRYLYFRRRITRPDWTWLMDFKGGKTFEENYR